MKDCPARAPRSLLQLHGVSKLGEFRMEDTLVLPAFDGEDTGIIALGSNSRELDYERLWRGHLARAVPKQRREGGWSNDLVLEAYVVNVRGASDPDSQGLLQPLLKRYQSGAIGLEPFGLPAVQAVVEWKWRSFARRLLLWELAVFVVWLLAFNGFTALFQDEVGRWLARLARLLAFLGLLRPCWGRGGVAATRT